MDVGSDSGATARKVPALPVRIVALAGLVLAADLLFYGQIPGLSLALFAGLVFAVAVAIQGPSRRALTAGLILFGASLPVVEWLQPLSLAFLFAGLAVSLVWLRLGATGLAQGLVSMIGEHPVRGGRDLASVGRMVVQRDGMDREAWRNWAFPAVGGGVLVVLLTRANPILSNALSSLRYEISDPAAILLRAGFWGLTGLVVWALLAWRHNTTLALTLGPVSLSGHLGLNARSAANALMVFNLALGLQTGLDIVYLWGGAALPDGLSYADYAHRGAYPLLATAILAGAFAVICRPLVHGDRALRGLLLLWIGQNIALSVSALVRLNLYVEAYGLTYLRLRAAIWMGVVALGLALIVWQVLRNRGNVWLLARMAGLAIGTLYLCAFVNFAHVIATHNLRTQPIAKIDVPHLTNLGPLAAAATRPYQSELGVIVPPPWIFGWRDWSFRAWRVQRYINIMDRQGHTS